MFGLMNTVANSMRYRMMPRRRNGMGTMTALVVGASVGIAAWEAVRKTNMGSRMGGSASGSASGSAGGSSKSQGVASNIAEEVMREIES
ncbi:hypothetical protein [Alicyclobacillus dauci]|uniref:YtxH-like protein n=1 Tax=Alicyclobacillus dauci TaxID=1475485 RepID=A0ABY6Z2P2_9BACL|nr:hypothetical protein [Alicyclobacillus dauci]WAH36591.1 hypothetical protein NZD86_20685 [Alicyclobacillus dauci]